MMQCWWLWSAGEGGRQVVLMGGRRAEKSNGGKDCDDNDGQTTNVRMLMLSSCQFLNKLLMLPFSIFMDQLLAMKLRL